MNSQEFTDAPAALRQPRRSQSQIRVSRTAGLPLDPNGPYLAAAEGLFNHAIAVGAEILRFTGAFLRGRRFFSSQTSLSIRLSLRRSTARRFGFRLGHRLSSQPLDRFFRLLSKDGFPRFRCFLITIRRIGLSSAGIAPRSWTASFGFDPSSSVTLACSGLPVGGRIPPGDYPSPLCSSIAGVFRGIPSFFRLRTGERIPGGAFDEVRSASVADVPFSRLSASPFFSRLTSRQGLLAVAFLVLSEEPLGRFPQHILADIPFILPSPIFWSTRWRRFP